MNRPIKFRAWDKKKKKMCFVSQVHFIAKGYFIDADFSGFVGDRFEPLMQFTGLTDKNGVEIFEGDVVQGQHLYGEVRFGAWEFESGDDADEIIGWFIRSKHPKMSVTHWDRPMDNYMKYCEVLGNIYQNGDLLS